MILMISQCSNLNNIDALYKSIDWNKADLLLVNQGEHVIDFKKACVLNYNEAIPLSRSRNIAMKHARRYFNMKKYSHIMFPDDDAFFLETFWDVYERLDSNRSYVLNVEYNQQLLFSWINVISPWKNVMSSNILLSLRNNENVFFREDLGVGTAKGSGEDIDFFWRYMNSSLFIKTACLVHPFGSANDKAHDMLRHDKYFRGHYYLLSIHKKRYLIWLSFIRPLVGIMMLRDIKLNSKILLRRLIILVNG